MTFWLGVKPSPSATSLNRTSSDDIHNTTATGKCPFHQGGHDQSAGAGTTTRDWWPNQLRVDLLNQHSNRSNPLGEDFDYRKEFSKLDYYGLKKI